MNSGTGEYLKMRDFTQVGKLKNIEEKPGVSLARSRRIIVLAVYGAASTFALAGAWLLFGEQNFFPREIAPILAIAFFVAAVMDVLAVAFMKKIWLRDTRG